MAQERVILLAFAHGEANDVPQRVTLLEGELAFVCQALDTAEAKLLSFVDKAVVVDW
jgi:hypothetical protein